MARFSGDLPERTFRFAVSILSLIDQLPSGTKGWELARQVLRSGTSIGANVREANQAHTDAEFAHKCSIARKEASETEYWLLLCRADGLLSGAQFDTSIQESQELLRILSTIVLKTQHHIERQ